MKHRIMISGKMLFWAGVLCCLVSFGDNNEKNPLMYLNRGQRQHFEIYAKINKALNENQSVDLKQIFIELYRPVRNWAEVTAPKFEYESMKAGDKAKTINNPRVRQEWIDKSTLYWDMRESCQRIVKAFGKGSKSAIIPEMRKILANEYKARAKRYPLPLREWLTQIEADNLLCDPMVMRLSKYKVKSVRTSGDNNVRKNLGNKQDDSEPRQGQVKRKQHDTRRREYGNGQTSGRGTRTQYNRRNLRQR